MWADTEMFFERVDEAIGIAVPAVLRQIDDIGALASPDEDRELIETLLHDQAEAVTAFAATTEAAASGDQAAMAALDGTAEDPFADVNRRAREYGLVAGGEQD